MKKLGIALCLALIATLGFISCSKEPVKWYRPGTSEATFARDRADCQEALHSKGTTALTLRAYSLEQCLELKGYTAIPLSAQ